jgi:predicted metal-dependent peptidase
MATATILQKAKTSLVISEPFYASILLNLTVVETTTTPDGRDLWLAATNGADLFINPERFNKLTVGEAKGLLKHEVMHVALMHNHGGVGKEPRRWNHACDYAINPIILDEGGELPKGGLDGTPFKGKSADEIYKLLPPNDPNQGGGGGGGNGGMDDDIMAPKNPGAAGKQQQQTMVAQAAQAAKARGKMPAHLKAAIDEVFRPRIDWKEQLAQWLTAASPSDYSFRRPNRMFMTGPGRMYLPGMDGHSDMESFGVLLDTSGSFTMDELKQGMGEVTGVVESVNPKRVVVAYCDAKVQHHDVFEHPGAAEVAATFERHGSGGTSMPAGLKWFTRKFPQTQAVVVWTDGETDFGNEDDYPFPVLWCITQKHITAPWGTTIHVDVVG